MDDLVSLPDNSKKKKFNLFEIILVILFSIMNIIVFIRLVILYGGIQNIITNAYNLGSLAGSYLVEILFAMIISVILYFSIRKLKNNYGFIMIFMGVFCFVSILMPLNEPDSNFSIQIIGNKIVSNNGIEITFSNMPIEKINENDNMKIWMYTSENSEGIEQVIISPVIAGRLNKEKAFEALDNSVKSYLSTYKYTVSKREIVNKSKIPLIRLVVDADVGQEKINAYVQFYFYKNCVLLIQSVKKNSKTNNFLSDVYFK